MEAVINTVRQAGKRAVNAFATDNFTASGASGLYDRARPTYPPEAVAQLLSVLKNRPDAQIVEVGAGTGIFTKCLLESPSIGERVARITAIEPSTGMREAFDRNFALPTSKGQKPEVEIVDGSFAEIPFGDASVDIVIGAQCFHWSHPTYAESVTEFARVLKPGGTLALIWNLEDRKNTRWVARLRDTYEPYEKGTPQYRLGWWRAMFETEPYKTNFEPSQHLEFQVIHPTTEQGVIDRVLSKSYITAQSPAEQEKISESIRELLKDGEDRVWMDEQQGIFEYPYKTDLYLMKKKGEA